MVVLPSSIVALAIRVRALSIVLLAIVLKLFVSLGRRASGKGRKPSLALLTSRVIFPGAENVGVAITVV